MGTLKLDSRGRVTLPKEVRQHLGVGPGDKIEFELLPDERWVLMRAKPSKKITEFMGLLAGRTKEAATIDEINEAAARGWSDEKRKLAPGYKVHRDVRAGLCDRS